MSDTKDQQRMGIKKTADYSRQNTEDKIEKITRTDTSTVECGDIQNQDRATDSCVPGGMYSTFRVICGLSLL